ncbi:MAG: hypothetical protein V1650_00005 [Candidatus Omnitrophota bacterium]
MEWLSIVFGFAIFAAFVFIIVMRVVSFNVSTSEAYRKTRDYFFIIAGVLLGLPMIIMGHEENRLKTTLIGAVLIINSLVLGACKLRKALRK